MRTRLAAAVAAATVAIAGAQAIGHTAQAANCPTQLACGTMLNAMLDWEKKANDAMRLGYMTEIDFNTAAQKPGDLAGAGAYYDSGLWTGVYLGGESMRYATAKHYLATHLSNKDKAFWTGQRDQALYRVRQMVTMYDRNINIAADWHTTLKVPPSVTLTDPNVLVRFGSSGIQGQPGMIMRACTPTNYPKAFAIPPADDDKGGDRIVGPFKWRDGKSYYCDGSPSRDTYAGTTFGLLTAFDLVSPDDKSMRMDIANNLMTMTSFLFKYGWTYPRPWGNVWNPTGNDFDNFISPLMVQVPMAQLNMANASRHVADAVGTPAQKAKFDAIWREDFAQESPQLAASIIVDSAQHDDGYFKWNLHNLTSFNLLRTTTGTERAVLATGFAQVEKAIGGDVNAHFEAIDYALTGNPAKEQDAILHLDQWLDYRKNTSSGQSVNNTAYCGGSTCTTPLPVAKRPPTDFLWQRSPHTDINGSQPATHRTPGIDYMTPYWMLRYESEVVRPANMPV